jgi:hypothetical protein
VTDRKPNFVLPVAVTLAALMGLYVGTYYVTVRRFHPDIHGIPRYGIPGQSLATAGSRALNEWAYRLFDPLQQLDRRLRPRFWGEGE